MIKLINGQVAAPFLGNDFSFDRPLKTFSVIVRGVGAVSAAVEIWWSPSFNRNEAVKIHSLNASGNGVAVVFESSEVVGGQFWASLTALTGSSVDVLCGV